MGIQKLNNPPKIKAKKTTKKLYAQFEKLLFEIRKREVSDVIITEINSEIEQLNSFSNIDKKFDKQLQKNYQKVFQLQKKELNLVNKGHYTRFGMMFGMGIGISVGLIFSVFFIGGSVMCMAVGMSLGMSIGSIKDKKAKEEGRQY